MIAEGTPAELKARLGATVIEVDLGDTGAAARAAHMLAGVGEKPPARQGTKVELTVDDGPRILMDVLRALDGSDLSPRTVGLREPSLDDMFLTLTGQRATTVATDDHEMRGAA